jgi:hypothetical protein
MTAAERQRRHRARPKTDDYFQRLARPPESTIKLIMGSIGDLDPDQREDLFAKLRKRYKAAPAGEIPV